MYGNQIFILVLLILMWFLQHFRYTIREFVLSLYSCLLFQKLVHSSVLDVLGEQDRESVSGAFYFWLIFLVQAGSKDSNL